jgi:histone acetyltransferase
VDYLDVPGLVARQRAAVLAAIGARPAASVVHPPLDFSDAATGGDGDFYLKNAARIPGLKESGYNPNAVITRKRDTVDRAAMAKPLDAFVSQLVAHDDSWPFRDPVDTSVVPDYLTIVSDPVGERSRVARGDWAAQPASRT